MKTTRTERSIHAGAVLVVGEQAVVFRYGRWALLTIARMDETAVTIYRLQFLKAERALELLDAWEESGQMLFPDDLSPDFETELSRKMLPAASDYLALFDAGRATVVAGEESLEERSIWLPIVDEMMKEGGDERYLVFQNGAEK